MAAAGIGLASRLRLKDPDFGGVLVGLPREHQTSGPARGTRISILACAGGSFFESLAPLQGLIQPNAHKTTDFTDDTDDPEDAGLHFFFPIRVICEIRGLLPTEIAGLPAMVLKSRFF